MVAQIEPVAQWFLVQLPRIIKLCLRHYNLSDGLHSFTTLQPTQMKRWSLTCLRPLILVLTLMVKVKVGKLCYSANYISKYSFAKNHCDCLISIFIFISSTRYPIFLFSPIHLSYYNKLSQAKLFGHWETKPHLGSCCWWYAEEE